MFLPNVGMPGISAEKLAGPERRVSVTGYFTMAPGGRVMDGAKTRDANNDSVLSIRAGTLMGKVTTGGKYANSFFGTTSAILAAGGTSITVAAAEAVEVLRRRTATGTITITGVSNAGGTVRTATATMTAINTTTGVITITALPTVNQVEWIRFNVGSTGGNLQLTVQKTDLTFATTANIAWNATDATYLAAINTQLDASTGVAGGIVATAIPGVDPDNGFQLTYPGTGYAAKSWTPAVVAVFPTTSTIAGYTPLQTASGAFAAGALIGDVDGSQVPLTVVPDGWGEYIPLNLAGVGQDIPFSYLPVDVMLDGSQLLPWPSDTSLQAYIRTSLKTNGDFTFTDSY